MSATVGTEVTSTRAVGARPSLALKVGVAGATLLGVVACLLSALRTVDDHLTAADDRTLGAAAKALAIYIESDQRALMSQVRILADDARIREPLATPSIDNATIEDLLGDLRGTGGYEILAVLDPAGAVRAIAGNQGLKGVDLGSSAAVKKAVDSGAAADVWSFTDRLVMIAVTPIRLGSDVVAYLLIGTSLDKAAIGKLATTYGVAAALVINDQVAASTTEDASSKAAMIEGVKLPADHTQLISGGHFVARVSQVDQTRGGRVLWLLDRHHDRGELNPLANLVWASVGVLIAGLTAGVLIGTRQS